MKPNNIIAGLKNSRESLEKGHKCHCYYCFRKVELKDVKEWVDNNTIAICPFCGIDSVLSEEKTGIDLTNDHLKELHSIGFE